MNYGEFIKMGFASFARTKLRSFLTTLGVVVGIGALVSMVSLGIGLQKNLTESIKKDEMVLTLTVSKFDIRNMNNPDSLKKMKTDTTHILNDSIITYFRSLDGVVTAYPDVSFQAKLNFNQKDFQTNIEAIPAKINDTESENKMIGKPFASDSSYEICLSSNILNNFGYELKNEKGDKAKKNSDNKLQQVSAQELIGKKVKLITASINTNMKSMFPMMLFSGKKISPFKSDTTTLIISGIKTSKSKEDFNFRQVSAYIPIKTATKIPRNDVTSVQEFLSNEKADINSYSSVYVKVKSLSDIDKVKAKIVKSGFEVYSITDQLKEMKNVFLILDSLLGIIGFIALFVASLGIINTMIMSIIEKTREIGIMKDIGGSENDIMKIFFIEASVIGFVGSLFGILLGWIVTRVSNFIFLSQIIKNSDSSIELFYFPWWLLIGTVAFSLLVSLLAGLYPALKAARLDPVESLRHN